MIVAAALLAFQSKAAPNDLPQLLNQIRAAYRTCKTYRDTGTQTIWNVIKAGKRTQWAKWTFATRFVRPGQLWCEVKELAPDGKVRFTSTLATVIRPGSKPLPTNGTSQPTPYPLSLYFGIDQSTHTTDSFVSGISSFASMCFGIVDKVPLFLLPTEVAPGDLAAADFSWAGNEKLGPRSCFKLRSKEVETTYWFDERTKLLIKLREEQSGSIKEIDYDPQINS